MSNTTQNQEIDLSYLFKSFVNFIDNIGFFIFRIFHFLLRNIIVTSVIIIIGLGIGYYLYENNPRSYKNEVLLVPNFNSTEYLYSSVANFSSKKANGTPELEYASGFSVEPVIDVYEFVSDNKQNLEIAKYMSENTIEVSRFKKDSNTEKLYRYHKLTYYTKIKDTDKKIFNALMEELNNDEYFKQRQIIEREETHKRVAELELSILNINRLFEKIASQSESAKEFNVDMYSQINDLMLTKQDLLKKVGALKVTAMVEEEKIIFDASSNLNIKDKSVLEILIPAILFVFLYLLVSWIRKKYKRYKFRIQNA